MENLTKPTTGKIMEIPHFPTRYQALIFRLWEMVPAGRIATVIQTTEEKVLEAAYNMGLSAQKNLGEWATRGYISILKAVWNLLPYEQIYLLLGWDQERLCFVLKEDDFLGIKLGEKCECPTVLFKELNDNEKERTAKLRDTVEKNIRVFDSEDAAVPFDFFNSKYEPLLMRASHEITVDSSWSLKCDHDELLGIARDFRIFAGRYGIVFANTSDKEIRIHMDLKTDDEEYHEVEVSDSFISINAGSYAGVLRAIFFLEDLVEGANAFSFEKKVYRRRTKIKTRFIYSFCGLYSDVLDKDSEISFPDKLLEGYARRGINGVWIQGVLYKLAPYPFVPQLSEGWEKRLDNLNKLTKRAARYGIKVYMYINEPRNLPLSFFERHPDLKGASLMPGVACLCTSHPETHMYLKEALQTICRRAPRLGGFFNITQTENTVLCYSNGPTVPKEQTCPVCSKKEPSEVISGALQTMAKAVYEVNPNIKFFYYVWSLTHTIGEEQTEKILKQLPKNVIILQVSETEMPFERGGIRDEVLDYSLSIVGPGDTAKKIWSAAKEYGLETAAKVQINNSWECSTVPFLPVYDNVVRHMQNLTAIGVNHIMLSWTLGGYISDNIKIASAYFFENENMTVDAYDDVLDNTYGEYAGTVKEAVHHFCTGFAQYPFNWCHIYKGPSNSGAANLLYPDASGMKGTMTCFPYDDLQGTWRGKPVKSSGTNEFLYPTQVLENQYRLLCEEWEKGLEIIKDMPVCEFVDMAIYGYTLFKSAHNQIRYYLERDGKADQAEMMKIVRSEKDLATAAYRIMLRNAAVGYEAANHYYVTRSNFAEKIVQCDYLLDNNRGNI